MGRTWHGGLLFRSEDYSQIEPSELGGRRDRFIKSNRTVESAPERSITRTAEVTLTAAAYAMDFNLRNPSPMSYSKGIGSGRQALGGCTRSGVA